MKGYGKVIRTHELNGQPWLTIWDLEHYYDRSACDTEKPPLKQGEFVEFTITEGDSFVSEVERRKREALPQHLVSCAV